MSGQPDGAVNVLLHGGGKTSLMDFEPMAAPHQTPEGKRKFRGLSFEVEVLHGSQRHAGAALADERSLGIDQDGLAAGKGNLPCSQQPETDPSPVEEKQIEMRPCRRPDFPGGA